MKKIIAIVCALIVIAMIVAGAMILKKNNNTTNAVNATQAVEVVMPEDEAPVQLDDIKE